MADKRTPSLDGLIQTKGAARPDALEQRVEAPSPARVLQDGLQAAMAARPSGRARTSGKVTHVAVI